MLLISSPITPFRITLSLFMWFCVTKLLTSYFNINHNFLIKYYVLEIYIRNLK